MQDNWPHEVPDVTAEFKTWIRQTITKLKIKRLSQNGIKAVSSTKKKRKNIPGKLRAQLQQEIGSTCPFCRSVDVGHFEIHHIDEVPDNNELSNLLMLCPTCHSKVTKGDVSKAEVIEIKTRLSRPVH